MASKEDLREKMSRFIDALIDDFGGIDAPMTRMNMLFLSHFMESQGIFLKFYKEYLDERVGQGDDGYEEDMKEIARKFLQAYLEILDLRRKNRDKFKKVQSEVVQDYLDIVQATVKHIHEEMSKPGANSTTS